MRKSSPARAAELMLLQEAKRSFSHKTCPSFSLQSCWVWAAPAHTEHGWMMPHHVPQEKPKQGHESQQESLHTGKLNVFLQNLPNNH